MIPQYSPLIGDTEIEMVGKYMNSGGWITEHTETKKFEDALNNLIGTKYCSVVANGTISLFLALQTLEVEYGLKVLVPDLTMIATPNSVIMAGFQPVLIDIERESLCMDLNKAKEYINGTNDVVAVINVTLNGRSQANLKEFITFCKEKNILFVSDDAQALGSRYPDNTMIGTKGDIASFSFSMPKIITTGQGGCLVTNNEELAKKIKSSKDFGRERAGVDTHPTFGINAKVTDLQATLGLAQLESILWRINRKKAIYDLYNRLLGTISAIQFIPTDTKLVTPWFVDIYVENRDKLQEYLKDKFGTRPVYPPIHTQGCYNGWFGTDYPITTEYANKGLWLPSSLSLTDIDIHDICTTIRRFYE